MASSCGFIALSPEAGCTFPAHMSFMALTTAMRIRVHPRGEGVRCLYFYPVRIW